MAFTTDNPSGEIITIDANETPVNDREFQNDGSIENNGEIVNNGSIVNNSFIQNMNNATIENNGEIVNNGISEFGNFQGIENNGAIVNNGSFENFGTLAGSGTFSGNALTIDAGFFEPNGFTVDTDFNFTGGTLRLPNISAGTRLTVTGDADLSGGNIDLVDPFGSFGSLPSGTFTLIDVAEHGELNIAHDVLNEAIAEVNSADTDIKDFELSQINNDLILTVEDINNDLDSEIDGTSDNDNDETNADDILAGGDGNDPFSGSGNEAADYFNFDFDGIFGAVLSLDVNLDDNGKQDLSSSNISPTDIINTIEDFIATKYNDRIAAFTSLNAEEDGVTADVAYEGSDRGFGIASADKFTVSGIFEGIDASIDINSFDDGVITTENFA